MRAKSVLTIAGVAASLAGVARAEPAGRQAASLGELVVTAAPYPVSLDSATTSIDIVTRKDLDVAPAAGLGDVLSGRPGLRSTFYGPGASRPVIRGLSGPRVMILQNGVGLVDASSLSPDHAVASEPGEAARIEVLRGPATLAYGGSAIGGVVNILDDRVPSRRPEKGRSGRVSASYGSVDDSHAVSGGLALGAGPWVLALDGVKRESGDYGAPVDPVSARLAAVSGETPLHDRKVLNTDVALEAYGAGLSYVGDDGYLGASVKRTETRYGLPFAQVEIVGPPPEEGPVYIDLKQTRYDLRGETALDLGPFDRARFSAGYADYRHAEIGVETGNVGTTFLSKGIEGRVELVQQARGGWQGAWGAQGLTRDLKAMGDEAFIPPVEIDEVGVFTLQRIDLGAWGLEGGLRLDRRRLKADLAGRPTSPAAALRGLGWSAAQASRDFTNVSTSVAAFWRPGPQWFLGLSLARNARAPTEFELYADGPHAGTGAYEIGDPRLRSEKAASLEATVRWTGERARVEAHFYLARYDGFIDQLPTGERVGEDGAPDPDGELPVFGFLQTDARFRGGEIEAAYRLWRGGEGALSIEGAYDFVHGASDAGPPARIPPASVTGRLVWAGPRLEAKLEVRHVGDQDRVAAFELPTDGYTLVGAQVSYRPWSGRDVRVFVDGRNLTNVEAREHASFLKDIAPSPGRTIRGGVAVTF